MKLSQKDREQLYLELKKRKDIVDGIRGSLFPEQLKFIDDPAPLKTTLCTRRAGKTYTCGADLILTCIINPRATCLYIATTREQAKRIMFKDVLKKIDRDFQIGMKFNHTSLEVQFPTGSVCYLLGSDSKPEEIEKALGQKYDKIYIDESGSHKQDQRHMVHSVLEPACADKNGTICLIGSPVSQTRSYFFDITSVTDPKAPKFVEGWSRHSWTWKENIHIRVNMQKHIDRLIKANSRVVETAAFRTMYLGEWVVDPGNRVYKYDEYRNSANALPIDNTYYHYLGLDLGFDDDTAIVIAACSENDPIMYFVEVFKQKKLDITAVAEHLEYFKHKYNPVKWIVDGASKQAVQELRNRHHFPLEPADKLGKVDIIEIMNADFVMGKIKLFPEASSLAEEYDNLIWDDKADKKIEHPACPNHGADAALYAWRMCFHYASKQKEVLINPHSEEGIEKWWDKQAVIGRKDPKKDFALSDWSKEYGFRH